MNRVPPHAPRPQRWSGRAYGQRPQAPRRQPYGQRPHPPPWQRRGERSSDQGPVLRRKISILGIVSGLCLIVMIVAAFVFDALQVGPEVTGGYRAWSAAAEELGVADIKVETVPPAREYFLTSYQGAAWLTQTHFVHRKARKVVSFEIATEEVTWEYPLPSPIECPSSAGQVDGRVVITTGSRFDCTTVILLDLDTGKEVWRTELPGSGPKPGTDDIPVFHGKRVAIGAGPGYYLLDLATGAAKMAATTQGCGRFDLTVIDGLLLTRRVCPATGDGIEAFDEAGERVWQWSLPQAPAEIAQILSADPLVVMITYGLRSDDAEVWKVDRASGGHTTVWEGTVGTSPCDRGPGLRHCPRGAVIDGKLVLPTRRVKIHPSAERHEGDHGHANHHGGLSAVDLETGRTVWTTPVIQNRVLGVITVAEGKIIAYQEALPGERETRRHDWPGVPGMVLSIDPATGMDTPLMALPTDSAEDLLNLTGDSSFGSGGTNALWDGERLAIYSVETLLRSAWDSHTDAVVFE